VILDKRTGSGDATRTDTFGYHWFLLNGHPGLQLADGGLGNYVSSAVLTAGVWTHLAVTVQRHDSAGIKFFMNGVVTDSANPTGHAGNLGNRQGLEVGARSIDGETAAFTGCLDEIEIFRRALSADEVLSLYTAATKGKCRP